MELVKLNRRVPSKDEIQRLFEAMRGMPQADNMKTGHFFVPGMYCRSLWRAAGTAIVGKVHKAPHFFLCAAGEIVAWTEGGVLTLLPGDVVESQPGTQRVTLAIVDSIGITVHKTEKTDLDEIEAELIEPDDRALFDSSNQLKSLLEAMADTPPALEHTRKAG